LTPPQYHLGLALGTTADGLCQTRCRGVNNVVLRLMDNYIAQPAISGPSTILLARFVMRTPFWIKDLEKASHGWPRVPWLDDASISKERTLPVDLSGQSGWNLCHPASSVPVKVTDLICCG
jgi:hypothetical protein